MDISLRIIHAFAKGGGGGNPAGVVLDANALSATQKQIIANKAGLPETAFVSRSERADFKLEFFTPIKQIPHCGHATIATFTYLKQQGMLQKNVSSKETIDGTRDIFFRDGMAFMEQMAPVIDCLPQEVEHLCKALQLSPTDLIPDKIPAIVNTGNRFLIVPVRDEDTMARITPDPDVLTEISVQHNLIGFYVFTPVERNGIQATTRMFAPYYGIPEEAGTGMAAGPLAAYLYSVFRVRQDHFLIEQGRFMKTPSSSLLYVDLVIGEEGIRKLFVGGTAYVKEERIITI